MPKSGPPDYPFKKKQPEAAAVAIDAAPAPAPAPMAEVAASAPELNYCPKCGCDLSVYQPKPAAADLGMGEGAGY